MVELTLKWEKFGLCRGLHGMMERQELVDVTVMCEGQFLQAHKNVLSVCSSQFRQIFKSAPDKNPIVVLRGVSAHHFKNILQFMYTGEVTVLQDNLPEFFALADDLGISALGQNTKGSETETPNRLPPEQNAEDNIQVASCARTRSATEHSTPVGPSPDDVRNETAFDLDCEIIEPPAAIKKEIEIHDVESVEWDEDSLVDLVPNTQRPPVIQSVRSSYVDDAQMGVHKNPGPSTSQGGGHCPEEPTPALRRTSRPIKRKIIRSPTPATDDSDNDEEASSSASQGFGDTHRISNGIARNPATTRSVSFKCTQCSLTFDKLKKRVEHENSVHEIEGAKCDICNKISKSHVSLYHHRSRYHTGRDVGVRHVCEICGSNFSLNYQLKYHLRNSHGGDLAVPHECKICHKIYKNKKCLSEHFSRYHTKL